MIFLAEVNSKFASSADLKITCYGNKDSFHGQSSITVSFFFYLYAFLHLVIELTGIIILVYPCWV